MNVKRFIVTLACLMLVLSFVGCGGGAKEGDSGAGSGSGPLQEIVEETRGQIAGLQSSLGDTMSIEISARGDNTLVYTFTFKTDVGDTEQIGSALAEAIEREDSVYEALVVELENAHITSPAVVVEYLDKDGHEIFSKTYK